MSTNFTATLVAALGVEPTYSAQEAAALLGRSYSWLDQGLRENKFTHLDGTPIEPQRTAGGYRRFTMAMLRDIAFCTYRRGGLSMPKLKSGSSPGTWCTTLSCDSSS
jgi:hypothetical protein